MKPRRIRLREQLVLHLAEEIIAGRLAVKLGSRTLGTRTFHLVPGRRWVAIIALSRKGRGVTKEFDYSALWSSSGGPPADSLSPVIRKLPDVSR